MKTQTMRCSNEYSFLSLNMKGCASMRIEIEIFMYVLVSLGRQRIIERDAKMSLKTHQFSAVEFKKKSPTNNKNKTGF